MNKIFQPAQFKFDRIAGSAKFNIQWMRYQKANFSEIISYFISQPLFWEFERNWDYQCKLKDVLQKMVDEAFDVGTHFWEIAI